MHQEHESRATGPEGSPGSPPKDPDTEMSHPRLRPAAPSINVTPLIDVLLVLLIIFMVIQPQREEKLPVRAPQPPQVDEPPAQETLMLTVTENMELSLNTRPVEIQDLLPMLSNLMEQRPVDYRTLLIKAPARVSYGSVVLLIDLAKGSGVGTVGLVSD
jgi:biopolymer transport protein ExbD